MGLFGKKDENKKDPPLAKVIGSKGKGGWLGKKSDRKDDNIVKKLGGYGTTGG